MSDKKKEVEVELDSVSAKIAKDIAKLAGTTVDKVVEVVLASYMHDADESIKEQYGADKREAVIKLTKNDAELIDKIEAARIQYVAANIKAKELDNETEQQEKADG